MKIVWGVILLAAFFAGAIYAPIDEERNQRAAEAHMKARLFTKFPDPAIAAMLPPAQNKD